MTHDSATAPRAAIDPDFFASYRQAEPAQRSDAELKSLIKSYGSAIEDEAGPPPDFPPMLEVETAMRQQITARLSTPWLGYFEYHAAWNARNRGDLAALRLAARNLEDLDARHPDLANQAQRTLLLADLRRGLGDYGPALAAVERLRAQFAAGDAPSPALRSNLLGLRSEILFETGRLEAAAADIAQSVDLAIASGDRGAIARALLRDQGMALATGRFAASRDAIAAQLNAIDPPDPAWRATLLVFRGYAESGLAGNDAGAIAVARATLDEARPDCSGHLRVRADLKRFELSLRAGDLDGAATAQAECIDSLGDGWAATPLARDAGEFIALSTRLMLARDSGAAALREWQPRQQLALAELGREWRQQPPQRGGIGFLHLDLRRDLIGESLALELALARAAGRTDGPTRALQVLLDLQALTSLARARHAPGCSVAELQRTLLAPDRAAVVFLPARRATWVFVVDTKGVACAEIAGNVGADEQLATFMSRLARAPTCSGEEREHLIASLQRVGGQVRERLLPDDLLQRLLASAGVTVVGADLLGGVPLEAVPLDDGRLLGEVVPIDNAASLPWLMQLSRHVAAEMPVRLSLLLLGCTDPAASVPEAAGIAGFAFPQAALAAGLDGYDAEVRRDAAATRASLLDADLAAVDVLQIVAHEVRRRADDGDEDSGLLLHDGVVWRHELTGRRVRGLVVVSSCGGADGPGRVGEGEGFTSLVGTFLWDGARAVIASRNQLQALDHLRLMARCHAHLLGGDSPARALQRARGELAAGSDLMQREQRALLQVTGAGQLPLRRR